VQRVQVATCERDDSERVVPFFLNRAREREAGFILQTFLDGASFPSHVRYHIRTLGFGIRNSNQHLKGRAKVCGDLLSCVDIGL
jgi:hypothetical protein